MTINHKSHAIRAQLRLTAPLTRAALSLARYHRRPVGIYRTFASGGQIAANKQAAEGTVAERAIHAIAMTGAIDRGHLARMTFGDRDLEHEVLQLFDRQAELLIARMRFGDAAEIAALAHTLKGSAAGIGAGPVAAAAEAAEQAAGSSAGDVSQAIDRLAAAVEQARGLIAVLLREA
jgi:HPt (histidine-containing phosphotransfer) domain-containing protein